MSAAQPKPAEPRPSEPSMEEILASIRRIISDDQAARPAAPAPAPAPAPTQQAAPPSAVPPVVEDEEEILELAPKTARAEPPERKLEPHFITDDPVDGDLSFHDPKPEPAKAQDDIDALMAAAELEQPPSDPEPPAMPEPMTPQPPERLLSPATDRVVSTAFHSLANTVLSNNARTLDDLVHEMLRPLIKSWLDENLPGVVERLVRAEIERVARGGR